MRRVALLFIVVGCAPRSDLVRLETTHEAGAFGLRLEPAPGARLNARLKPALELADGSVLRFDSPHLTPDSAYFAEPPVAVLGESTKARSGLLRASVCPTGESVCRTVELAVRF